jgi:hypothetical protein
LGGFSNVATVNFGSKSDQDERPLLAESGRWLDPMMDWMQSPPPPQLIG